jgi:hypothetical protein
VAEQPLPKGGKAHDYIMTAKWLSYINRGRRGQYASIWAGGPWGLTLNPPSHLFRLT